MMTITIDSKWCKGCALCVRACPKSVLAIGQERSGGGYLMPYAKDPDACIAANPASAPARTSASASARHERREKACVRTFVSAAPADRA